MIEPVVGANGVKYVMPQYHVLQQDGSKRRIDFAIVTPRSKIALELDGYTYHAEGKVSRKKFSDDLARQNELVLAGWRVIRFSWDMVQAEASRCCDALRRALVEDEHVHPVHSSIELQPHAIQQEVLQRLSSLREAGVRKGLVVLATGLGKTLLAAFDAKRVGGRVLFIVHNNSILEQAQMAFRQVWADAPSGLFNGNEKIVGADLVFANIASLRNQSNLELFNPEEFDYIIVDEFHHAATESYRRVIDYFEPQFLLALTATPERTDTKPVLDLVDGNIVYEMNQGEAIRRGFLVPFKYFGFEDDVDYSNIRHNGFRYYLEDLNRALIIEKRDDAIVQRYFQYAAGRKAIGFCVSIEHAIRAAEHFSSRGIRAKAIHSRMTNSERQARIEQFRAGEFEVAFVRDIFNEGIDFPDVGALLFMRPTESKIILTQQIGRGLRLFPGKNEVMVLDFIGNYLNVHRVVEFVTDAAGGSYNLQDLQEKPEFRYDNGCEVHFSVESVNKILLSSRSRITDRVLVEDFSRVVSDLGRSPTIAELETRGHFPFGEYIAHYGSWTRFLERMRNIVPDLNLEHSELPSSIGFEATESVDDLIALDISEFNALLDDAASAASSAIQSVLEIGNGFPPFTSNQRMNDIVWERIESAKNSFERLLELSRYLSSVIALRINLRNGRIPQDCGLTKISQSSVEAIISNLRRGGDQTEAYTFPRSFSQFSQTLDCLAVQCDAFTSLSDIDETIVLGSIGACLVKIYRKLLIYQADIGELERSFEAYS